MLSRFFGKDDKAPETPAQPAAQPRRGVDAMDDDAGPGWGMWGESPAENETEPLPLAGAAAAAAAASASPSKTRPLQTPEQRKNAALALIEQLHPRIANTIHTLWGYKECGVYLNKLIMAGGDGMGQSSVSFNREIGQALLTLSDMHDREFGPAEGSGGPG